jgi:hypothetical protein
MGGRPAARRSDRPQGQPVHTGRSHHRLIAHTRIVRPAVRRDRGDAPGARRRGDGKTNCDEFAVGSTENSAFGPSRSIGARSNPGRIQRRVGRRRGSPPFAFALGSDTGRSIPARRALWSLVGLKPTRARLRYGLLAFASSLDQIGRDANGARCGIDAGRDCGPDPADATSAASRWTTTCQT